MQELFYALWGTLLAPIIVALVVTNLQLHGLTIKTKNKQEKDELPLVHFFGYIAGNFIHSTTYV